ncbi:hypothetical protein [Streptomyces lydicus]|uniref:hypothetical protein n=1 Tax=Streptomyces lydicus TaxID=47763 RepID=UPI0036FD0F44
MVVAHATASGAYAMAQEAGADVITHVPLDRALEDEAVKRMAADGRIAVPTLTVMEAMSERMDGARLDYGQAHAAVAALHRVGVPVLAGTDADSMPAFVPYGTRLHHEPELLVDAGSTTVDACAPPPRFPPGTSA